MYIASVEKKGFKLLYDNNKSLQKKIKLEQLRKKFHRHGALTWPELPNYWLKSIVH